MDAIIGFLTHYGYWGMFLAAFLAGSFFPFSSEAVMLGLMATGLDPDDLRHVRQCLGIGIQLLSWANG